MTRRSFAGVALAVAGALLSGCLSPTLPPLPPPDAPTQIEFVADGDLLVVGSVPAKKTHVLVINHDTDQIFGELSANGDYSLHIAAQPGDYLELWYVQGAHSSSVRGFEAPHAPARPRPSRDAASDAATDAANDR